MTFYEMSALIDNLWMKDKSGWEQTKMITYMTAQVNSTKKISPDDIMKFPWDDVKDTKEVVKETKEDRKRVMEEMREIENKLNNR